MISNRSELTDILATAITMINFRIEKFPNFTLFNYIRNQLEFIKDDLEGKIDDYNPLKFEINIDIIAVRELDDSDPDLAQVLKKIAREYDIFRQQK